MRDVIGIVVYLLFIIGSYIAMPIDAIFNTDLGRSQWSLVLLGLIAVALVFILPTGSLIYYVTSHLKWIE